MLVRADPVYRDAKRPTVFQDGMEFQDFVCQELAKENVILQNLVSRKYQYNVGENLQGFEIKFDGRCTDTQRLSIEVAEKSRKDANLPWTPSGIMRNDNSWLYIQGNYKILFIFAKSFLVGWHRSKVSLDDITEKAGTIQTFYLNFDAARKYAARVMEFF